MTTPAWPRVGVGACIRDAEGRLLLVLRRRDPEAGHWGLPGGKVEPLEPLRTAVAREIAEELGIAIAVEDLLCVVDQIDPDRGTHWVAPTFLARIIAGTPSVLEPDALGGCGWFAPHSLPEPLTLATREAVAALSKHLP